MGVQPWVAGPTYVVVGRAAGGGGGSQGGGAAGVPFAYLGTAERTPQVSIRPGHIPFHNDIGGAVIGMDSCYQGSEAFVSVDLTRWDEKVYQTVAARPTHQGVPGFNNQQDVGTLMIHEGFALQVMLIFPFSGLAAYAGMPPGIRFHAAVAYGPDDWSILGTTPRKLGLLFHCLPKFTGKGFQLYDFEVGAGAGAVK